MVIFSLVAATDFPHHYPENRHRSSVDFGQRIFLLPAVLLPPGPPGGNQ